MVNRIHVWGRSWPFSGDICITKFIIDNACTMDTAVNAVPVLQSIEVALDACDDPMSCHLISLCLVLVVQHFLISSEHVADDRQSEDMMRISSGKALRASSQQSILRDSLLICNYNVTAETDKVKSEGGDMTSKFYRKSKMWTRVSACALHSILLTFMKRARTTLKDCRRYKKPHEAQGATARMERSRLECRYRPRFASLFRCQFQSQFSSIPHNVLHAAVLSASLARVMKDLMPQLANIPSEVFVDNAMSRARVFIWHKRFSEGRQEVEDDERPGLSVTSRPEANVQKINEIEHSGDRRPINDELNMTKVCAKLVPKNLIQEQKDSWKNVCSDIMKRLTEEADLLTHVITVDRHIPVLEHSPYSPDLAPYDFHLFSKVKSALKGTHFQSVEEEIPFPLTSRYKKRSKRLSVGLPSSCSVPAGLNAPFPFIESDGSCIAFPLLC
ncbi:hypothetical protein ANN_22730 [Periplaneta americana]|uniref:Uncharacterized protein n=1 Tax=Periplaneta americana TaxID=6978 RepID=A0ABQ8SKI5_PERAM|nr:hypothetical protein ANN_22730 [Periplaneta americana]